MAGGSKAAVGQTALADAIDASEGRARVDAVAKRLIAHRAVLAEILKGCADEFRGLDTALIERECMGEVRRGAPVDQGARDADTRVAGSDTEDASDAEGLVRYDLVFDARVPATGEAVRLVVNVEVQVDASPGYPLVTRAIYYLARLVSRQKGTVFTGTDYGRIRKVYSIWVCPNPAGGSANSIADYGFSLRQAVGKVKARERDYDKMRAVVINLGDDGEGARADVIRLLGALLSTTMPVEKRKEILHNEFNIPMTREIEEGVRDMCSLGMAIQKHGQRIGEQVGKVNLILSAMRKQGWGVEEAMDILGVDEAEREALAASVREELARADA